MAGETGPGCLGGQRRLGLEGHFPEGQEGERHSGACVECDRHGRLPWSSPQRERSPEPAQGLGEPVVCPPSSSGQKEN